MNRLALALALAITFLTLGCDVQLDACTYDEDGRPPVVVSQCMLQGLEGWPSQPPVIDGTCEDWCASEGMAGLYTLEFSSPDACPAVSEPVWDIGDPDDKTHIGIIRCACTL